MRWDWVAPPLLAFVWFGAGVFFAHWLWDVGDDPPSSPAVAILTADEGFRGDPYTDTTGHRTIGYGTKLPITKAEGVLLLRHRLPDEIAELVALWPAVEDVPRSLKPYLYAMAYQLGPHGEYDFTDMRAAIDRDDWHAAADAALDSEWAREAPHRAKELADALRAL